MKQIRQLHYYLSLFFAPAIIFLAFTGAVLTFDLQESRPEKSYDPPIWLKAASQVHKHQSADLPKQREGRQREGRRSEERGQEDRERTGRETEGRGPEDRQRTERRTEGRAQEDREREERGPQVTSGERPAIKSEGQKDISGQPSGSPAPKEEGFRKGRSKLRTSVPLKWFFLCTSFALVAASVTGIFMVLKSSNRRVLSWSLLILGTVIPVAFLYL